jgi:hypothetical protein
MTGKAPGYDDHGSRANSSGIALSLGEFLRANRKKYPSMTAFAKAVGLSRHTIMQICDGRLAKITPKTRSAIFAATGLADFSHSSRRAVGSRPDTEAHSTQPAASTELQRMKSAAEVVLRSAIRLQDLVRSDLGPIVVPIKSESPEQHVERVRQVLSALDQELSFFKVTSREREREILRLRIDPKDVGYIIALLRALYSKEAFDNWVLASGYSVR